MDRFENLRCRAEALLAATSPIYAQTDSGALEAVGTGIFFKHDERHFVLSAGHVLRHMNNQRLLIGDNRLALLNGRFFRSPNDDIDLGFVPLTEEQFALMSGARFLSADDANLSGRPETEPGGHRFYVVGFRADMNVSDDAPTTVESDGAAYLAHAAPDTKHGDVGLSAESHLVLAFDRNILFSEATSVESEEEPQGMSGAGVWQFTASRESDKLVAILIEYSNTQRVIIATRIRPLLDALTLYAADVIS
jgi:hypothetical protein